MQLATLQSTKEYLNIVNTDEDGLLLRLINAASSFIELYCGRKFDLTTYTDVFSGNNMDYHVCDNYPVRLYDGGAFDDGCVYGFFPKGRRNCSVTYSAGFMTAPPELEQACIYLVGLKYRNKDHIEVASKSLAGDSTSYITTEIPASVKQTLNLYRKVV